MSVTEEAAGPGGRPGVVTVPGQAQRIPAAPGRMPATGQAGRGARRPWGQRYLLMAALADCLCAITGGELAGHIRFGDYSQIPLSYDYLTFSVPVLWCFCALLSGGYDIRVIGLGSDEFRRVINAAAGVTAVVIFISYTSKLSLSRSYVGLAILLATALDLSCRYLLRKHLHALRGRGRCSQRVVAVGHAGAVADLVYTLRRDTYHGLTIVAACVAGADQRDIAGVPVAGAMDCVATAVRDFAADTVAVLACPEIDADRLRELAWKLEKTSTDLFVAPILLDVAGPRTMIRPVAGLPLLHVDHPDLTGFKQVVKGVFDRAAAAAALIVLSPLFVAIACAIKWTSSGPVLFRQTRVGRDGRDFTLCKFRTMSVNADRMKLQYVSDNESDGPLFKIRRDPRVTGTGRWLRRWSLDELPQLLNVLVGDMSLVGPRPALPEETQRYSNRMRRRLAVKPGMTGLWQVSGRSDLPWDEAVRLDVRYVENWSFALDLQILWKTGSAVIGGSGAY